MDFFFLVFYRDNTMQTRGNSLLEKAIQRYLTFVHEADCLTIRSVGNISEREQTEIAILDALYKAINDNVLSVVRVNHQETDRRHLRFDYVKTSDLPKFLQKSQFPENPEDKKYWYHIISSELSYAFFGSLLRDYTHRKNKDIVNSEVGLLKIWCDNSSLRIKSRSSEIFNNKSNIFVKAAERVISLRELLREKKDRVPLEIINQEIVFLDVFLGKIAELIGTVQEEDCPESVYQDLSQRLAYLYEFISRYCSSV